MFLHQMPLKKILFVDIETVPQTSNFAQLSTRMQLLWEKKAKQLDPQQAPAELYAKAGLYAEFGKVVCISLGFIWEEDNKRTLRLKSFYSEDEKKILQDFASLLSDRFSASDQYLCAHNGKSFDFPFLSRRMLINGVKLPLLLNTAFRKSWEINHLDTMEIWKFGDYRHLVSLDLLAAVFDIPSPKDDMSGADVSSVFWDEKNLERIESYCRKDIVTLAQLFLKLRGDQLLSSDQILFSES